MMKPFLFILLFCFCFDLNIRAQDGMVFPNKEEQKMFVSAKSLFDEKLYTHSYDHFNYLLTKHPKNLYLKYLKGICCIFIGDKHEEALQLLTEVKAKNPKAAEIDYYFALYFHKTYQFDLCIDLANTILQDPNLEAPLKEKLKQVIEYSESGKEMVSLKLDTRIENLGGPPNTEGDEYSPVITADEKTLLFTYRGKLSKGGLRNLYDQPDEYGFYYEDIYMSKKVDGKWQQATGLENVNTESNEAALAISNDGQELYIYRATENDGGDIYRSRLEGTEFGIAEWVKGEVNTESWEGSIALSGDGKKIIFASDRPGGYGGKDLYSAVRLGENTWGKVKNLGDVINTTLDEDGPFIHPDGRSLVFSSQGHSSFGDFDIFLSELNEVDSTWKKPVNVGFPINTTDDDIFYTLSADGKRGYFSSSKPGGFGNKDIYVEEPVIFSASSHLTIVKGTITDNLVPFACNIDVLLGEGNHYATYRSNRSTGEYLVSLPAGRNYKVVFDHPTDSDRVVNVNMEKKISYSELIMNINFGQTNATPIVQSMAASPSPEVPKPTAPIGTLALVTATTSMESSNDYAAANDQTKTAKEPLTFKPKATSGAPKMSLPGGLPTTSDKNNTVTFSNPVNEPKSLTRAELFDQYATSQIKGLKYQVQVGAYRKPENFDTKKIEALSPVKNAGIIDGGINLLVVDKEFSTWKAADEFMVAVRKAGQKDAFVTADYNGKRLYMKEVAESGLWGKPLMIALR